ncbi:MAG: hypothetical protein IJ777_04815 [Clostridia bacterium]|nr:hypothetical protein [Clostridia bacterium]
MLNGIKKIKRFILKRGFNLTPKKDIDRKEIVNNNKLNNENELVILDFINNRSFKTFDRDETGKITRSIKKELRIRVEYDIT